MHCTVVVHVLPPARGDYLILGVSRIGVTGLPVVARALPLLRGYLLVALRCVLEATCMPPASVVCASAAQTPCAGDTNRKLTAASATECGHVGHTRLSR